jgi:uncharacterized membrane protein
MTGVQETATSVLHAVAFGVGCVGAVTILWGVVLSVVRLVGCEVGLLRGRDVGHRRETLRHQLGTYLLLGLEFLIAADVIETVIKPSLTEIGILAGVVLIRTVIGVLLDREMTTFHRRTGPD